MFIVIVPVAKVSDVQVLVDKLLTTTPDSSVPYVFLISGPRTRYSKYSAYFRA